MGWVLGILLTIIGFLTGILAWTAVHVAMFNCIFESHYRIVIEQTAYSFAVRGYSIDNGEHATYGTTVDDALWTFFDRHVVPKEGDVDDYH